MLNTELAPWPCYSEEEAEAVKQVLLSNRVNYWTGEQTRLFEQEFAAFADCRYAVAVANGTLALDAALQALQLGPGDEVIVPPRTFIATVSAVVNAGATPVFADVDLNTQALCAETIAPCLSTKTKAIVVVHLAGMPAEMDAIMALANQHGLWVIEDCAQAHGARYHGRSVGSLGHIAAWSFCQDKIMTTGGEGGMVTTNDETLWQRIWSLKDHGKSYDAVYHQQHPPGFRWLHHSFGHNWRMMEVQAVIGRIQLQRMPAWSARRRQLAAQLDAVAADFPVLRRVLVPEGVVHAEYKHYFFIRHEWLAAGWSRDSICQQLMAKGVPCYQGSCGEVYLEQAFENTTFRPAMRLPQAKELSETSLMLLVHPSITEHQMERCCYQLAEVLQRVGQPC
ncbi:DegT/DnrJ/EryC1/StrS aminotransferase family protein [Alkalimonas sp. MEB108]|uniref:DegT/DnrJ/EryC1/StrS aminotransferase family protein n=1 Tax=Alkalimonas cellulosilytica TaxID=3058395 RepID=A0ABU7J4X1_9GAMM|nr:DegT/DnrJ/EryC1/StrS aminotransferase family protein [Alkalimonas sp. MEB108]MEE2001482.1 DegT/DnrJ/EryC1/StrS aminotransferase family protein [Alkalimonas sp. MEB108]